MSSTLTAGGVFGVYQGYYPISSAGSLSPNTFGGFTCDALITGITAGSVTVLFTGDARAFLTGQSIVINGVTYSTITSGPAFDGSITQIEWAYGPGNFTVGNSYTIDIGAGGPANPNITTPSTANNLEGTTLSIALTADKTISSWTIVGGADQSKFEISGTTLRWASNGTKSYSSPDDADTNNTYIVTVRATDTDTLTADLTITVTVLLSPFKIVLRDPGTGFNIKLSDSIVVDYVYQGVNWSLRYLGSRSDASLYLGTKTLHP